jgi:hypothetical protein
LYNIYKNPELKMSLESGALKIRVSPEIRLPYLELLTSYGQVQQQMKADVERLPPAFQHEVYARISHAYGRARDAGLGQTNLTLNLTLLNNALIEVTNDVSNAYTMLSLFKARAPVNREVVSETFQKFSAEAQLQIGDTLGKVEGDLARAVALVFKDFDPTIDQAKGRVKVGPAIKLPYLELLTSYGRIQEKMKADVERLPLAFQQEVYARLSIYGGYSEEVDFRTGKQCLVHNLTALNDVLIEVTTDVSTANHVLRGLEEDPSITLQRFSPTSRAQIEEALSHVDGDFKAAVARVFKDFNLRKAPQAIPRPVLPREESVREERAFLPPPIRVSLEESSLGFGAPQSVRLPSIEVEQRREEKRSLSLPPPRDLPLGSASRVQLVQPVAVDEPRTLRLLCAALEERRTEDANRFLSQLSKETQSAIYRVLCYYYGTPTNNIEKDGATNWQEDPTGLVRPVTIDGRRPIDLLDAALKPAEGMQVVVGRINQYDVENGHDACAVISTLAITEFLKGKLQTQDDVDRIIREGAGAYEASVQRAKELDGMAQMTEEDGKHIPSTSALVMAGFGIADDLRQRNFIESGSIETWLGPLKRNVPHIALLTIGTSTMALMYDRRNGQWVYFNSHGDDQKSVDLVTEHTTAVLVTMTEKALIAFLRRKIDAVDPNQVGYIHAMS